MGLILQTIFENRLLLLRRRKGEGSETFVPLWLLGGIIFVVIVFIAILAVYLKMGKSADAANCASNSGFLNMIYEAWDKAPVAQNCG